MLKDETLEKLWWEKVIAAYDKLEADPGRAIPADEVFAAVRARHGARKSTKSGTKSRLRESR